MKMLCVLILAMVMLLAVMGTAIAESKTITLGNDVTVNTTPFVNSTLNRKYTLFAGMVVTVEGEYDGWTVIHYTDEFGTLYIETGEHKLAGTAVQIPTAPGTTGTTTGKIIRGVVGEGWQVWARYEPKKDPDNPGDRILHQGDVVEIIGDVITDEEGNEFYPIRVKNGEYYVPRYVTAKYIDIILE